MNAHLPVILGYIDKNSRERIRVAIEAYSGHTFLDVRVFALGDGGEPKPTKQGVTIRLDRVRDLQRLIDSALQEIEALKGDQEREPVE